MVARRAHNPEVVGSSPASATKKSEIRHQPVSLSFCTHVKFRAVHGANTTKTAGTNSTEAGSANPTKEGADGNAREKHKRKAPGGRLGAL